MFGVDSNDNIDDCVQFEINNLSSIWKASTHEIFTIKPNQAWTKMYKKL